MWINGTIRILVAFNRTPRRTLLTIGFKAIGFSGKSEVLFKKYTSANEGMVDSVFSELFSEQNAMRSATRCDSPCTTAVVS